MRTINEIIEILKTKHGDTVKIKPETYNGFRERATFVDKDYGEWEAFVYSICRGSRHKQRALHASRFSEEKINQRLKEIFGDLITLKPGTYSSFGSRCVFIDSEFGEWEAFPQNVFRGSGHPKRCFMLRGLKIRHSKEEVENMIRKVHGDKVKIEGEYTGMLTPTLFRSATGSFTALPVNVIHNGTSSVKDAVKKREETTLKKLGVKYWVQNDELYDKYIRNLRSVYFETNWKTGEEQVCRGSWELKVVKYLNDLRVDYIWQPKTFKMPSGKTYRPDAYIIDWNLWVEIKGRWLREAKTKWEWFHSIYTNSELWDKTVLKTLQII